VLLNLEALERQNENKEKIDKIRENVEKSQIRQSLQPKKIKPMKALSNSRAKTNTYDTQMEKFNINNLIAKEKENHIILNNNSKELSNNLIGIVNDIIVMPHKNPQKFKSYVQNSNTMQTIIKRELEDYSIDNLSDRSIFTMLYMSYYSKALF